MIHHHIHVSFHHTNSTLNNQKFHKFDLGFNQWQQVSIWPIITILPIQLDANIGMNPQIPIVLTKKLV